jgi:intracellular sulfur oxidation DsrE/DsrF family protein
MIKPLNKSPQMILKAMLQQGVVVQICPLYLANKGITEAEMFDGITKSDPYEVAPFLMRPDTKLFTF